MLSPRPRSGLAGGETLESPGGAAVLCTGLDASSKLSCSAACSRRSSISRAGVVAFAPPEMPEARSRSSRSLSRISALNAWMGSTWLPSPPPPPENAAKGPLSLADFEPGSRLDLESSWNLERCDCAPGVEPLFLGPEDRPSMLPSLPKPAPPGDGRVCQRRQLSNDRSSTTGWSSTEALCEILLVPPLCWCD